MPLIISGMSIHRLALCPSSPAASNFPRRVRPAKKWEFMRFSPAQFWWWGSLPRSCDWSRAATVGKLHFPAWLWCLPGISAFITDARCCRLSLIVCTKHKFNLITNQRQTHICIQDFSQSPRNQELRTRIRIRIRIPVIWSRHYAVAR